jgi:acetyl esterase/lipase
MHAGRTDYLNVLRQHGIYAEVKSFDEAPHSFPLYHPWFNPMMKSIDAFLRKVFATKSNKG